MSSQRIQTFVQDIVADGVSEREVAELVDAAAAASIHIGPTHARSAVFDLSDIPSAKRRGISGFVLTLSRQRSVEHETWVAEFRRNAQNVRILLRLAKPE